MNKYIDAEKLKEKIKRRLDELNPKAGMLGDMSLRAVNPNTFPRESELEKVLYLIDSLQQEQPDDLASLISEATNVAKRIVNWDSFYNSLPQNLRNKYTSKAWCEILEALSTMKEQEQLDVDLKEEINKFFENVGMPVYWCNDAEQQEFCSNVARHFYELGLSARKEE